MTSNLLLSPPKLSCAMYRKKHYNIMIFLHLFIIVHRYFVCCVYKSDIMTHTSYENFMLAPNSISITSILSIARMTLIGMISISVLSCGDTKLNYKCTCTQIAYNDDDIPGSTQVNESFSENICDTYDNIQTSFGINGDLYNALQDCEDDLSKEYDNYSCDCECFYQSEC